MKILFAAPDRDLLECYKKLLEADLGETAAAFDGTQVISLLSTENFDILILDQKIPRVNYKTIIDRAHKRNIPVIVLTDESVGVRRAEETAPDSWLSYPFTFRLLTAAVHDTLSKIHDEERIEPVNEDE